MSRTGRYGRDAAIESFLSIARRETLVVAVAACAMDDEAAAIGSARLRWAVDSARELILAMGDDPRAERRAQQIDRIANRAQRYLGNEPPRPLREIGTLVDRVATRRRRGPGIDAHHTALVDLDLDDLDLARISFADAHLTEVTLRRSDCTAADARASRWLRCQLEGADLVMAVLAGAVVEDCDFSRARLAGTSWHRAKVSRCDLRGVSLVDARLDRALVTECDLRGADLAIARSLHVASLVGTRFVRCDLRETHWGGRELGGATFIECKLFGARGAPALAGA
jgi:uncharacterized protein YjbI with pentapeptide repeats